MHLAKAKDCPDICGNVQESTITDTGSYRIGQEETTTKKTRIVNGVNAQDRGFIVLIRAFDPQDLESYESCGGTLINDLTRLPRDELGLTLV